MATYKSPEEQFEAAVRALSDDGNDVLAVMIRPDPAGARGKYEIRGGLLRHKGAPGHPPAAAGALPWPRSVVVRLVHAVTAPTYPEDAYETPVPFPPGREGVCLVVAWTAATPGEPVHAFMRVDPAVAFAGLEMPPAEVAAGAKLLAVRALAAAIAGGAVPGIG